VLGIDSVIVEPGSFPTVGSLTKLLTPNDRDRVAGYGEIDERGQAMYAYNDQVNRGPGHRTRNSSQTPSPTWSTCPPAAAPCGRPSGDHRHRRRRRSTRSPRRCRNRLSPTWASAT